MNRFYLPALALLVGVGCSHDATAPARRLPVQFLSGNGTSDTVDATIGQPLAVILSDGNGALAPPGTAVQFTGGVSVDTAGGPTPDTTVGAFVRVSATGAFVATAVDTTDASGRASVTVKLGTRAGPAYVVITVPALGIVDTARFTVRPGAAVRLAVVPPVRTLATGNTYQLTGG